MHERATTHDRNIVASSATAPPCIAQHHTRRPHTRQHPRLAHNHRALRHTQPRNIRAGRFFLRHATVTQTSHRRSHQSRHCEHSTLTATSRTHTYFTASHHHTTQHSTSRLHPILPPRARHPSPVTRHQPPSSPPLRTAPHARPLLALQPVSLNCLCSSIRSLIALPSASPIVLALSTLAYSPEDRLHLPFCSL